MVNRYKTLSEPADLMLFLRRSILLLWALYVGVIEAYEHYPWTREGLDPDYVRGCFSYGLIPALTIWIAVTAVYKIVERWVLIERQRIARDLHDSLAQSLTYLRLKLDLLTGDHAPSEIAPVRREIEQMREVVDLAYQQVQHMLVRLREPVERDLAEALLGYAHLVGERAHFKVQLHTTGQAQPLSTHQWRQIHYLLQEALANIEQHAQAQHVWINLTWTSYTLTLVVADDGRGFDPAQVEQHEHFGLRNMRERIDELNGSLTLETSPGRGAKVTFQLPLGDRVARRNHHA